LAITIFYNSISKIIRYLPRSSDVVSVLITATVHFVDQIIFGAQSLWRKTVRQIWCPLLLPTNRREPRSEAAKTAIRVLPLLMLAAEAKEKKWHRITRFPDPGTLHPRITTYVFFFSTNNYYFVIINNLKAES
jgi:hypothetical protein